MGLEDQGDRGHSSAIDNQHLKTLVGQNPHQSVSNGCRDISEIQIVRFLIE